MGWRVGSENAGAKVSKRGKDRRGKEKRRYLYLVLDGWSWG
jgi:hypothetical protein